MTLQEAAEHIGSKVTYCEPGTTPAQEGVITSVNEHFVFVRYGSDYGSKATPPWRLTLLAAVPAAAVGPGTDGGDQA